MIIRTVDSNNDWLFGKGRNDYVSNQNAAIQLIRSRLLSFLGDCFFDSLSGIAWFTYLGAKDQAALNLAIATTILNTPDDQGNLIVTGLNQLNVVLNSQTRNLYVSYEAVTVYSVVTNAFVYDLGAIG